ncbi:hypothetical protein BDF20DRAFT_916346 [Mycotypha africana]|uniref:uncharacterized protein n=1 Tax=Mycotypha africana TaxID=64632 RepID=UPI002300C71F|nr:uncharacterized protein BDF20DRAFT_916346 [Mycotypha africana]KAI8968911.1 hypothetical protein BDF20DRAFT_916346 [Mycotypha africana]
MRLNNLIVVFSVYAAACISLIHGYCVYNFTDDVSYRVRQLSQNSGVFDLGRFYRESLKPGESACCPYTNHDCNSTGDKNALIKVMFLGGTPTHKQLRINFPAGGWVEIRGKGTDRPKVNAYYPDGTPFPFELVTTDSCFFC